MLILLPPSEGKTAPVDGAPLNLERLSFPELATARSRVVKAVVQLSSGRPARARSVLRLSVAQDHEVERNRELLTASTAPAGHVYSGVLYDALGYRTLSTAAQGRIDRWVVVTSALWGSVRMRDPIPAYRLSGDVALPRIGPLSSFWRKPMTLAIPAAAGAHPILDLRSGTYARMWSPGPALAAHTVVARVLHRRPDGRTQIVSHFNKATKGRLVRALANQRRTPTSVDALVDLIASVGFETHPQPVKGTGSTRLDIVVDEV